MDRIVGLLGISWSQSTCEQNVVQGGRKGEWTWRGQGSPCPRQAQFQENWEKHFHELSLTFWLKLPAVTLNASESCGFEFITCTWPSAPNLACCTWGSTNVSSDCLKMHTQRTKWYFPQWLLMTLVGIEDDEEEHHVNRKKRMRENRKQILIWRVISYMSCNEGPRPQRKKKIISAATTCLTVSRSWVGFFFFSFLGSRHTSYSAYKSTAQLRGQSSERSFEVCQRRRFQPCWKCAAPSVKAIKMQEPKACLHQARIFFSHIQRPTSSLKWFS